MKFSTKTIHAGQETESITGAIIPPVYLTSTFVQEFPDVTKGYDYTRSGNPNFSNLETTLASLEEGKYATVFSSGVGATTAIAFSFLKQGDVVIAGNDLYGGTLRLFESDFKKFGISFSQINTSNLTEVEKALEKKPKMIFLESPTNPLLQVSDIKAIQKIAKKYDVLTVVDNTFATPFFQQPLTFGVDLVLQSTTKYIGGHSDIIGGAVITNDEELHSQLHFARMSLGLNPSPFDTWLTSRGVKTLAVRMERHAENAMKIAQFLESHKKVKKVYYPGLPSHPQHEVAKKQMSGFSGIVSVVFDLNTEQTKSLISSLSVFTLAESLGGVESLIEHPASMTHASIPREDRIKNGLDDGLVRISIGIESATDLIDDLSKQLDLI